MAIDDTVVDGSDALVFPAFEGASMPSAVR